jgi:energy-coupling factor transporter ATP-binding protein EcfA2
MIERVRLQNIKVHRDTEIALGRFTVLVGPNGAGKTSVLQALDLMCLIAQGQKAQQQVGDRLRDPRVWALRRRGADTYSTIEIHGHVRPEQPEPEVRDMSLEMWPEKTHPADPEFRVHFGRYSGSIRHAGDLVSVLVNLRPIGTARILELEPRKLAAPAYTGDVTPQLSTHGDGLAEVIAHMTLSDPTRVDALQESLRAVVPQVDRIRVQRARVPRTSTALLQFEGKQVAVDKQEEFIGSELLFDVAGCKDIPAHAMSEGTLIALGILALMWGPDRPDLVLIDSIERSLHPTAQWQLIAQLRRILEQFPELQIVATTHSPDLVDRLAIEEVVVMSLDREGVSKARPLSECPRQDMLDVLSAGELWSAMGEGWVAGEDS